MTHELDEVDTQLLTLLQRDARYTATDLAEHIDVSDNTIHNRMADLETAEIIDGYNVLIDPRQVGLQFHYHFTCTTSINERAEVAEQIMAYPEVVEVTELMTGLQNLHLKLVGRTDQDITRMAEHLDELNLEINDENLIRAEHTKPIDLTALEKSQ